MSAGGFFSVDSLRGVIVLVVASHPAARRLLVEILVYCGALVTPVAAADDALRVMRQVKPDLVIVDAPEDDQLDLIRRVRSLKPEDGGVVPAVAIARAADDERLRGRGFQASVPAPIDPWALCRLISGLLTVPR